MSPVTQSHQIEEKVVDATRILTHWLIQSMPGMTGDERQDLHAEMRDVVRSIVDAAVLSVVQHEQRTGVPL